MKKICKLILVLLIISLFGCSSSSNTPSGTNAQLFRAIKKNNAELLNSICVDESDGETLMAQIRRIPQDAGVPDEFADYVLDSVLDFSYSVNNVNENGDKAVVNVTIRTKKWKEVVDGTNLLFGFMILYSSSEKTIKNYKKLFNDHKGTASNVTYTLDINLVKINDEWKIDLSDSVDDLVYAISGKCTEEDQKENDASSLDDEKMTPETDITDTSDNTENSSASAIYWGLESVDEDTYELHLSSASFTETMAYSGTTDGIFQYNTQPWNSYKSAITRVSIDELILPSRTAYWFYGLNNVTSIEGLNNLDTSNDASMASMFFGCSSLTALDLSGFDTSNVVNMHRMFFGCSSLTSLDLSNFDTSNATMMTKMFYNCSSLISLDISGFDTSNVTDMYYMFYNCSSLTSLDVSCFDTTSVEDMSQMFFGCSSLVSLDLSGFDTSSVTGMTEMFRSCSKLEHIYAGSGWNTNSVSKSDDMFTDDESLHNYSSSYTDKTKAVLDDGENGGYLE